MNAPYDIERDLTRWMADVVPTRAPDNLAPSIVANTRSMRPRPAWLARLKEPPMQTQLSLRNYLSFGRSLRPILVALLILVLLAGAVIVGSRLLQQQTLPPPFGVAGNGAIAADLGGAIVLTDADGSGMRRLDLPFGALTGSSFSRDGTRIAAWASRPGGMSLIVVDADGSGAVELDPSMIVADPGFRITWSPDDRRLAFSGSGDRLFVADIDARTVRELDPDGGITRRRDPNWSPDGQLAYRCQENSAELHLCVMSADFTTERVLATSPGTEWAFQAPSWSHDGRSIAYQVDDAIDHTQADVGWDIATIDVATGVERLLTRGFVDHAILPVWSPDNQHVLFGTAAGPGVVRIDGTDLRLLAERGCDWLEPSPDGVSAACLLGGQIHLYPIAGGPPTVIELGRAATSFSWQRLAN
jgi:Tol biopolymer transport system component